MSIVGVSLDRAYGLIDVKGIDDEKRTIRGMATTPTVDRGGDIVNPYGVKFKNPLPFILHHDKKSPVGTVTFEAPTDRGIPFTATIPKVTEPGIVRDRTDEAWHSAKYGLLRGVSIGYRPLKADRIATGGYHLQEIEVVELSMVAVPMNAETTISAIKSLDQQALAAYGTGPAVITRGVPRSSQRTVTMDNVSEQLTAQRAVLQEKSARLQELLSAKADGTLDDADAGELATLQTELPVLTDQIKALAMLEAAQAAMASPASITTTGVKAAPKTSTKTVETVALPKGTTFTRYALAIAAGKGSMADTLAYAKRFSGTPEVLDMVRQKANEGTSVVQSPGWGGELVNPNTAMTEFVELLMPETIIGKVTGFDRVPFNIPIITQTGGSTFNWVEEGDPKPVGELAFDRTTMGYAKCAGIIVMTEELVRLSSPSAEARARQDMVAQCRKFLDEQFIRVGETAGTSSPASITNTVASPPASGTDVDALKYDLMTAMSTFTAAGIPLSGLVIVTTPELALGISLLTNQLGQTPTGFNVTPQGGSLLGYPVIVSDSVDSGHLVIFKPSEIFLADDGQVRLDASNQATLDMAGSMSPTFSLWQRNCVGIRAERWINWRKRRSAVVAVIDTASYGPSVGSP